MSASFSQAFDRARARTRRLLFDDFDPGRYLTIGLAAFLALLIDGCSPTAGGGGLVTIGLTPFPLALGGSIATIVVVPLLALAAVLLVLALWLAARGQLIFLESVIYERSRIREPWQRLAERARPLFLWTLGLAAVSALLLALVWAPTLALVELVRSSDSDAAEVTAVLALIAVVLFSALLTLVLAATWVALHHFVVPLYYRDGGSVGHAWRKLAALVRANPADFVFYAIGLVLVHLAVQMLVGFLIFATCCIIDPLLRVPYLSTLFYLPLLVFLRAFSVEFLGQFGEAYRIEPAAPEIS